MDDFTHDIIRILGDLKMVIEQTMKKLEDLATKKAIESAEQDKKVKEDESKEG